MMLAAQLLKAIAHDGKKRLIGIDNLTLNGELDHRKGTADRT